MRVALRRLRATLRIFRKVATSALPELKTELRQFSNILGGVRDMDVFLGFLGRYTRDAPRKHQPFLDGLTESAKRRRRMYYQAVIQAFAGSLYTRFERQYLPLVAAPNGRGEGPRLTGPAHETVVFKMAPRAILKCLRKVAVHNRHLEKCDTNEQHRLRIECKRLRYIAEFFSDIYPGNLDEITRPMVRMQKLLGSVHDASIYSERVNGYHRRSGKYRTDPAAGKAVKAILAHLESRRRDSLAKAASVWRAFTRRKALREVVKIVGSPRGE